MRQKIGQKQKLQKSKNLKKYKFSKTCRNISYFIL